MHASNHQGGTEVPFHAIHVHLDVGNDEDEDEEDDEDDDRLLFLESKITSDLDANLATISRLPIPAARMRAVKPYLLARFT